MRVPRLRMLGSIAFSMTLLLSFNGFAAYAGLLTSNLQQGYTDGEALGRLRWGLDEQGQPWTASSLRAHLASSPDDDLSRQVRRVIQVAQEQLGTAIFPAPQLRTQGLLASDPTYRASIAAAAQFDIIYGWATCARLAEPPAADRCRDAAVRAVTAWVGTYQPSGDPIDEAALVPLLQSLDLVMPLLTPEQQAQALSWTAQLAREGEALFAAMSQSDTRRVNNWFSWHLAIKGMAARITADPDLLERTRADAHRHIAQNIAPDGSTYDFQQRDALHYHIYDLLPLVYLDLFTGLVSADDQAAIATGLGFLRPFFTRELQHLEFANSTVAFDRQRREAGDHNFDLASWDPSNARQILRLARGSYPSIQEWSASVVDESYSPRLKQLAALFAAPSLGESAPSESS